MADCIEIISEPGTINNATFPAATSMATVNSCQLTGNVIWEALARMFSCVEEMRDEVTGLCYGGVAMAVLAGQRKDGTHFVNMFTDSVGGGGARSYRDGVDTCGNLVAPAYAIPNVERIESLFPILYLYRKERAETAGAGLWRGGVGIEYMIKPHEAGGPIEAVFFGSAAAHPETKGASGGFPGSVQRSLLLRGTSIPQRFAEGRIPLTAEEAGAERIEPMQAKDAALLEDTDAWVCFCDGGGGYGDPLDREPENVVRDVRLSLCTAQEAARLYGVKLDDAGAADAKATVDMRAQIRENRLRRGRRLGEAWRPGLAFEGHQLFRYGEILAVRKTKAGAVLGCMRCGNVLCPATEDPRQRALMVEEPLSAFSPLNRYGREDLVVVRHYCCPGCATVFSTDVQLKNDDPCSPEMELEARQFDG